ncbi:MAG: hypothetical protein IJ493_12645 [Clostridia bacterium]|nr:hypothetical protein [Clostridia bacterium]
MITIKGFTPAELAVSHPDIDKHPSLRFYDAKSEPFRLYGFCDVYNDDIYRRIPESVAKATSPGVLGLHRNTAGGRVRFCTSSPYVAIKCVNGGCSGGTGMSTTGSSGFDVYTKRTGRETFCVTFRPDTQYGEGGYVSLRPLSGDMNGDGEYEVTINFPPYANVYQLYIGLDENATLSRHPDYTYEKPVLYYGSSITQGGHASRPGMIYEALISRRLDTNYINLGFAGNCRGEDAIAEYMASLDYSVFVCDYDHNAPSEAHLAATHEKLYLKIRTAHPDVPVVFVTRPNFWLHYSYNSARRDIIYTTYNNARQRGEKVLFVDGYGLFAGELREECTSDGTHPNDLGMARMADVIGKAVDFALSM